MARLRFRISTIVLDEEEEVCSITAVVRDDTLAVIGKLIGEPPVLHTSRGGTELTIVMPVGDVIRLFHACGKTVGPDYEHTSEIYESLSFPVYRMIEED